MVEDDATAVVVVARFTQRIALRVVIILTRLLRQIEIALIVPLREDVTGVVIRKRRRIVAVHASALAQDQFRAVLVAVVLGVAGTAPEAGHGDRLLAPVLVVRVG